MGAHIIIPADVHSGPVRFCLPADLAVQTVYRITAKIQPAPQHRVLFKIFFCTYAGGQYAFLILHGQHPDLRPDRLQVEALFCRSIMTVFAETASLLRGHKGPFDWIRRKVLGKEPGGKHIGDHAGLYVVKLIVL